MKAKIIKNLVYFCYFKNSKVSEYTLYNLKALSKYLKVFNGQKIVKIAVDDLSLDNKHLELLFPDFEIEIVQNHPEHRESEYFIEAIEQIKVKESFTFYAHNKGGTTDNYIGDTIKFWLSAMYFFNLAEELQMSIEEQLLADKVFSGILRKDINCAPWVCVDYHYSGTFFWFNTEKVLNTSNWNSIKKGRYSIEEYPGTVSTLAQSHSTFMQHPSNYDTYSIHFWKDLISRERLGNEWYDLYSNFCTEVFGHNLSQ